MAAQSTAHVPDDLTTRVAAGDRRSIARLISLVEADDHAGLTALRALQPRTGKAHVIGVTGAPGTGKSTLVDKLIAESRRAGKTVGVIAIDPSSPFTGGAILGDRIRMQSRSTDPDVFIRSMGTRGALGGLGRHAAEAVRILDAAGKDVIFVETVGVGQAEVDIVRLADTVLVVLVPNLGDDVQAVKAGIMEIADVFVVNKADLTGADKVASEVEMNLSLAHGRTEWIPLIISTVAEQSQGITAVMDGIAKHRAWSESSGEWRKRRAARLRAEVRGLLERAAKEHAFTPSGEVKPQFQALFAKMQAGKATPDEVAQTIFASLRSAK